MQTTFLATEAGWTARIQGERAGGRPGGHPTALFFYAAIEDEYMESGTRAGELRPGEAVAVGQLRVGGGEAGTGDWSDGGKRVGTSVHVSGEVDSLGPFSIVALASHGAAQPPMARVFGEVGTEHAYAKVRERVSAQLLQSEDGELPNGFDQGARLAVVQVDLVPPFTLDIVYVGGGCSDETCERVLRAVRSPQRSYSR